MRALLGKLVVCLLLVVGTVGAWGEDKAASSAELEKLQDQVRALDKDVSILKEVSSAKLEAQDKRLADLGWVTAQQANYISWTSIGITVLAFVAGFFSYITATRRAKEEARKAAREWFDEEANKLREQIKALEQEVAHGRQSVHTHVQSVADVGKQAQEDIEQLRQATESVLRSSTQNGPPPDAESVEVVQKASTELEKKPEAEFTAEDHYTRGTALYSAEKYENALLWFKKAAGFPDLSSIQLAKYLSAQALCLGKMKHTNEAILIYKHVYEKFNHDNNPELRYLLAQVLFNNGIALTSLDHIDEAIACYNQLIEYFNLKKSPELHEPVAMALVNKGSLLGGLNQNEEAIFTYNYLIDNFGLDTTPPVQNQLSFAINNKGLILKRLNRSNEAIACYDHLIQCFDSDPNPILREQVAKAMLSKGFVLETLNRSVEAIACYDQLIQRFDSEPTPAMRERTANALFNKGVVLGTLNRTDEAIARYDQIIERFGSDPSAALRELVAKALFNKGFALGALNRTDEAIVCYDQLIDRFGSDPSAVLRELVAKAINGQGLLRLMQVKQTWGQMDNQSEQLTQAAQAFRDALERCSVEDKAMILGNLGYVLFLQDKKPEAREITLECLRLGQEKALAAQRGDAQLHRIEPQDTTYEAMLTELWAELQNQNLPHG